MWLNKLERKFGKAGIPNLMLYVVVGSLIVYIFDILLALKGSETTLSSLLYFDRDLFLQGQVWRIITFVLIPPQGSMFVVLVSLYFYYIVGSELEMAWGAFRFTVYYLFGIVGSIIAGLIAGGTTAVYLNLSLFFAFAALFPNRQLLLFFIIPVKVKWLGLIDAVFFIFSIIASMVVGDWQNVLAAVMAVLNFLIFFGPGFISDAQHKLRYLKSRRDFKQKISGSF